MCLENSKQSDLAQKIAVYEDEAFIATYHLDQKGRTLLGLMRITTKRHVHDLGEMNVLESQLLGTLIKKIRRLSRL